MARKPSLLPGSKPKLPGGDIASFSGKAFRVNRNGVFYTPREGYQRAGTFQISDRRLTLLRGVTIPKDVIDLEPTLTGEPSTPWHNSLSQRVRNRTGPMAFATLPGNDMEVAYARAHHFIHSPIDSKDLQLSEALFDYKVQPDDRIRLFSSPFRTSLGFTVYDALALSEGHDMSVRPSHEGTSISSTATVSHYNRNPNKPLFRRISTTAVARRYLIDRHKLTDRQIIDLLSKKAVRQKIRQGMPVDELISALKKPALREKKRLAEEETRKAPKPLATPAPPAPTTQKPASAPASHVKVAAEPKGPPSARPVQTRRRRSRGGKTPAVKAPAAQQKKVATSGGGKRKRRDTGPKSAGTMIADIMGHGNFQEHSADMVTEPRRVLQGLNYKAIEAIHSSLNSSGKLREQLRRHGLLTKTRKVETKRR